MNPEMMSLTNENRFYGIHLIGINHRKLSQLKLNVDFAKELHKASH